MILNTRGHADLLHRLELTSRISKPSFSISKLLIQAPEGFCLALGELFLHADTTS